MEYFRLCDFSIGCSGSVIGNISVSDETNRGAENSNIKAQDRIMSKGISISYFKGHIERRPSRIRLAHLEILRLREGHFQIPDRSWSGFEFL